MLRFFFVLWKLADFVKRNEIRLRQEDFAERVVLALTVIRKIEQGEEI
jgi:hypothetical protein